MSEEISTTLDASTRSDTPRYEAPRLSAAGSAGSLVRGAGGASGSDRDYYYYFYDDE